MFQHSDIIYLTTVNKHNTWTKTNKCYIYNKVKGNILPEGHVSTSLHLVQKYNIEDNMKGNLLNLLPTLSIKTAVTSTPGLYASETPIGKANYLTL